MINNIHNCIRAGRTWTIQNQADRLEDDCILQADNGSGPAPAKSCKHSGMWWIDRILIILAAVLFIMTVTAQLCIYLKKL